MTTQDELSRVRWRCRRGTRELDFILQGFVDRHYARLDEADRRLFRDLLEVEDPQLTEWLCFDVRPGDPGMAAMVEKILTADGN